MEWRGEYACRGVEAAFVSVGGAVGATRTTGSVTTSMLKAYGAVVVDIDELVAALPPEVWVEGWRLTSEGYLSLVPVFIVCSS